jgi:Fe-S-cluster containining protein
MLFGGVDPMCKDSKLLGGEDITKLQELPAGSFSSWLRRIRYALIKENGADVPCGECNACCKSSYFIHIRPEETQTLIHIPKQLLFAAPFLPKGNVLLGYDENGCCPMMINDQCSIYEHRSITCRNYDCRIFTAAGIEAGDDDKAQISERIRRWQFSYPTKRDRDQHSAVQAAAKFLQEHAECFPGGAVPNNASQLAILALKVYDVFLKNNDEACETTGRVFSDLEVAKAIMVANERFEARRV